MASNYKVNFSVSLTPTVVNSVGQSIETTALDAEIRKTLGGSGIVGDRASGDNVVMLANGTEVTGYGSGTASYLNSNGSSGNDITVGDVNNITIVKNTGHRFDSSSVLGAALTKTTGVWTTDEAVEIDADDSGVIVAILYPGEAVVFPRAGNGVVFHCSSYAGSVNIAIEYAVIIDGT